MLRVFASILLLSAFARTVGAATLSNAVDVARLLQVDKPAHAPFDLKGVVTSVIPHEGGRAFITVRDGTGNALLVSHLDAAARPVAPGSLVRAKGTVRTVRFKYPRANITELVEIAPGPIPAPQRATARDIRTGRYDLERVRLVGFVSDVIASETNDNWIFLVLRCEGESIYVSTPLNATQKSAFERLTGAYVQVDGIPNAQDGSYRFFIGRILHCAGLQDIRTVRPPAANPFDVPALADLRKTPPAEIAAAGRHAVDGEVLARWNRRNALVRTDDGDFSTVMLAGTNAPACGTRVRAVGFPESDLLHLNLSRAVWRALPNRESPAEKPRSVHAAELTRGRNARLLGNPAFHGQLVRIGGIVRSSSGKGTRDDRILLDADGYIIPVDLGDAVPSRTDLPAGTHVEVTGVCILDADPWRPRQAFPRINGCFVVLTDEAGLRIVSVPSWWTPGRAWTIMGVLLALLVAIFVWNWSLRILAARRGREIFRRQIQAVRSHLKVRERTRLAVELHDAISQNLTGISMELKTIASGTEVLSARTSKHLGNAMRTLGSCRNELRNVLWDLRHDALDKGTMNEAVETTLVPHLASAVLAVRFNVPRALLSDNLTHTILNVLRELCANAVRHGRATRIWIAAAMQGQTLRFSVRDNGVGFDCENVPGIEEGHFGLVGISERIDALDGRVRIESDRSSGTKVTITIPLDETKARETPHE